MLFRDLSSPAVTVYMVIYELLDHKLGEFDYSIDELCQITGKGRSTIGKGLDDLVDYEILEETVRPGHTTLYKLISEVPIMTPEEKKEFDEFQKLCENMTPEELDEFAKKNGNEIIIIRFPEK
jgi:hypothetical protein